MNIINIMNNILHQKDFCKKSIADKMTLKNAYLSSKPILL